MSLPLVRINGSAITCESYWWSLRISRKSRFCRNPRSNQVSELCSSSNRLVLAAMTETGRHLKLPNDFVSVLTKMDSFWPKFPNLGCKFVGAITSIVFDGSLEKNIFGISLLWLFGSHCISIGINGFSSWLPWNHLMWHYHNKLGYSNHVHFILDF